MWQDKGWMGGRREERERQQIREDVSHDSQEVRWIWTNILTYGSGGGEEQICKHIESLIIQRGQFVITKSQALRVARDHRGHLVQLTHKRNLHCKINTRWLLPTSSELCHFWTVLIVNQVSLDIRLKLIPLQLLPSISASSLWGQTRHPVPWSTKWPFKYLKTAIMSRCGQLGGTVDGVRV